MTSLVDVSPWQKRSWETRYARYGTSGCKTPPRKPDVPPTPDKKIKTKPIPEITDADRERFFSKVEKSDGCWLWTGQASGATHKYGSFCIAGRTLRAHRIAYVIEHGSIPEGMVLDHLCRTTLCVNPAHLEAVTTGENTRRGDSYPTHCKRGHELAGDNVHVVGRQRRCRACKRIRIAKHRAQKNG